MFMLSKRPLGGIEPRKFVKLRNLGASSGRKRKFVWSYAQRPMGAIRTQGRRRALLKKTSAPTLASDALLKQIIIIIIIIMILIIIIHVAVCLVVQSEGFNFMLCKGPLGGPRDRYGLPTGPTCLLYVSAAEQCWPMCWHIARAEISHPSCQNQ